MRLRVLNIFILIVLGLNLVGQSVKSDEVIDIANKHMELFFPGGIRNISGIEIKGDTETALLYSVSMEPEGWILVSGNRGAEPVLGFSFTGDFRFPEENINNPNFNWISSYEEEILELYNNDLPEQHPGWKDYTIETILKGTEEETVTVFPLIDALWNQGTGWNIFCPVDEDGPGGHTYVGCVAVAMAQAMSVYMQPDTGIGFKSYVDGSYGNVSASFGETAYQWDSMSMTKPDSLNALLLYQAAISVTMNFEPDGSSAYTSHAPGAMRNYFGYSWNVSYKKRSSYNPDDWIEMLISELVHGRPLIYAGNAGDGSSGHAFNLDGVMTSKYFHVNWGWGGKNNGYFLIDNLKPGTRDYTQNQAAVTRIQPLAFPTDILLSNYIVPEDEPPGSVVGKLSVVDESYSNEYIINLETDSTYIDGYWVSNYYIENDSLKTGIEFPAGLIIKDTIHFNLTDLYDNILDVQVVLSFETTASDAIDFNLERQNGIVVYPNPVDNILYISDESAEAINSLLIYSLSGQIVRHINNPPSNSGINLSGLNRGIYILEAKYNDGIVIRKKLIKN